MTAFTLPSTAPAAPASTTGTRAGFDIGPATRTAVGLAAFTMSFMIIWALGRAALGIAPDVGGYAKLAVILHIAAVLPTIPLGGYLLLARKGTAMHKRLGKLWMALMLITATTAIFIQSNGSFSWIHLFVPLTFHAAWKVMQTARAGNITAHKNHLVRTYLLALMIPGLAAFLAPGRLMHVLLFG